MASDGLVIAVAQIASSPDGLEASRRRHREAIDEARERGADVLVFPELSLSGHASGAAAMRVALRRDDAGLAELAHAAGPMWTVVGAVEASFELGRGINPGRIAK